MQDGRLSSMQLDAVLDSDLCSPPCPQPALTVIESPALATIGRVYYDEIVDRLRDHIQRVHPHLHRESAVDFYKSCLVPYGIYSDIVIAYSAGEPKLPISAQPSALRGSRSGQPTEHPLLAPDHRVGTGYPCQLGDIYS